MHLATLHGGSGKRPCLEEPGRPQPPVDANAPLRTRLGVAHAVSVGGAPDGEPQPMHYVDARGVKRQFMMALEGSTWRIWRAPGEDWNGPHGPGFNQRFIGEISADGKTIEGRWERGIGDAGDEWEIDFPINYFRK